MRKGVICLIAAAAIIFGMAGAASACGLPPPPSKPPPIVIIIIIQPPVNQKVTVKVCVQLETIFPTTIAHNCSCALVIPAKRPGGTNVLDVQFARVDLAGGDNDESRIDPIAEFESLTMDDEATAGFEAGPAAADRALLGQKTPGRDVIGFAGVVPAVTPPPLETNQIYAMVTTFEIPEADLAFLTGSRFQIGAGVGNTDGSPIFDPADEHSSRFSAIVPPPPAAWAGLGLLGALGAWRKRRALVGR